MLCSSDACSRRCLLEAITMSQIPRLWQIVSPGRFPQNLYQNLYWTQKCNSNVCVACGQMRRTIRWEGRKWGQSRLAAVVRRSDASWQLLRVIGLWPGTLFDGRADHGGGRGGGLSLSLSLSLSMSPSYPLSLQGHYSMGRGSITAVLSLSRSHTHTDTLSLSPSRGTIRWAG